jgi:hypothetical protein
MPRAAVINLGRVVNIVAADDDDIGPKIINIEAFPDVAIGWKWDGAQFTAPPAAQPEVPQEVTMAQARLALIEVGKLDDVQAAINAIALPKKRKRAQAEWDFRPTVRRRHGLVIELAPAIGLDDAALDALFILASQQ